MVFAHMEWGHTVEFQYPQLATGPAPYLTGFAGSFGTTGRTLLRTLVNFEFSLFQDYSGGSKFPFWYLRPELAAGIIAINGTATPAHNLIDPLGGNSGTNDFIAWGNLEPAPETLVDDTVGMGMAMHFRWKPGFASSRAQRKFAGGARIWGFIGSDDPIFVGGTQSGTTFSYGWKMYVRSLWGWN